MAPALDQSVPAATRVPKIYLSLREASAVFGVSKRLLLRDIRLGRLRAKRVGRDRNRGSIGAYLISVEALRTWFDQLPAAEDTAEPPPRTREASSSGLSLEDQVDLGIGQVARAHALLDQSVRAVLVKLAAPGLGEFLRGCSWSIGAITDDLDIMLDHAAIEEEDRLSAKAALKAAALASTKREHAVHDAWIRQAGADAPLTEQRTRIPTQQEPRRPKRTPRGVEPQDLAYLEQAIADLTRANARVAAVLRMLEQELPPRRGRAVWTEPQMQQWRRLTREDFAPSADRDHATTDPVTQQVHARPANA